MEKMLDFNCPIICHSPQIEVVVATQEQTATNIDMWSIVFVGIVIVFITLIGLTLLLSLTGKMFGAIDNAKKKQLEIKEAIEKSKENALPTKPEAPVVEDGISEEVVAAISAAIAAISSEQGVDTKVVGISKSKKINPDNKGRNSWRIAGLMQNTDRI